MRRAAGVMHKRCSVAGVQEGYVTSLPSPPSATYNVLTHAARTLRLRVMQCCA